MNIFKFITKLQASCEAAPRLAKQTAEILATKATFPVLPIARYFPLLIALILISPLNPTVCISSLAAKTSRLYLQN
jgi:hypothetical protein